MNREDYEFRLHQEFNFPLDVLREYICRKTDISVSNFIKIVDGVDSEVYDIGKYIAKIGRNCEISYSCIQWAMKKCKERNIKVPEVIHCGRISNGNTEFDIMVEEKIDGNSMTSNLYEEAGAELKKIHSIKVDGFWKMYELGKFYIPANNEKHSTDGAYSPLRDLLAEYRAREIFSFKDIEYMEQAIKQHENLEVYPVLCHGDFVPSHILCGKSLNGIIDFGDFQGGSIYIDIACFAINSDEKHFDKFIKGYGEIDRHELALNTIFQLLWDLIEVRGYDDKKDEQNIEQKLIKEIRKADCGK